MFEFYWYVYFVRLFVGVEVVEVVDVVFVEVEMVIDEGCGLELVDYGY